MSTPVPGGNQGASPLCERVCPFGTLNCTSALFTYGTMYGMRRTTIYLPDELKLALERTAAAQGTSEAEVVRHALIAATAESSTPKLRIPLFDSGDATLAERVDDELAAGFGE